MSSLNPTDFPGNAFATAKALRQSALKSRKNTTSQHGTFALQINSICDLALEMVMAAAADHAPAKHESE